MTEQWPGPAGDGKARHRAPVPAVKAPAVQSTHAHLATPRRTRWVAACAVVLLLLAAVFGWRALAGGTPSTVSRGPVDAASARTTDVRIAVRVGADGVLTVVERVDLPADRAGLTLTLPERSGVTGRLRPRVENLRLRVDGRLLPAAETLTPGRSATFRLPGDASQVLVEYTARNAVLHSRPSAPGRGLALATPLRVEDVSGLSSSVHLIAGKVLSVGCVGTNGELITCGSMTTQGWRVERGRNQPVPDVVAQVDLAGS